MRRLFTAFSGLAMVLIALGPMLVIVIGLVLFGTIIVDLVRVSEQRITTISAIINDRITPQLQSIQRTYVRLADQAEDMKEELDKVLLAVTRLQDIQIARGQFGNTPSMRIRVPERDVSFGPIKIDDGRLFDETVPSVPVPASPVSLPMTPLRQAFAPLGPNGPVGKAV